MKKRRGKHGTTRSPQRHGGTDTFEAITVDGNIIVSRGVRPGALGRTWFAGRRNTKGESTQVYENRVCDCSGDLANDLLCANGCYVRLCPQFAGLTVQQCHWFCKWYLYNNACRPDHSADSQDHGGHYLDTVKKLERILSLLELVELMLPEEQLFTAEARLNIVRSGRDSLRKLPKFVSAGGSELAGRSRIRKYLLPDICAELTELMQSEVPLAVFTPVHVPTVLTPSAEDELIRRSLFGRFQPVERDCLDDDRWVVVKNRYVVPSSLRCLVDGVIASEVCFINIPTTDHKRLERVHARAGSRVSSAHSQRGVYRYVHSKICSPHLTARVRLASLACDLAASGAPSSFLRLLFQRLRVAGLTRAWEWVDAPPDAQAP